MPAPSKTEPVLITGCSSGLGQATAMLFRQSGYLTVATARLLTAYQIADEAAAPTMIVSRIG